MSVKFPYTNCKIVYLNCLTCSSRPVKKYVVQRNGKDCAVIVSARQWRQRTAGQFLDTLGPAYRVSRKKQARIEGLLEANQERSLTSAEQRELKGLLRQCDAIMLRRASALERLS